MEAQGVRRYSSSSFTTSALDGVSGQRYTPAALYPQGKDPSTHWTGGWTGTRASLDTEIRNPLPLPEIEPIYFPNCSRVPEICSHSAIWEILSLLWKRDIHYHVHKNPLPVSLHSQMTPVHTLPSCLLRAILILCYVGFSECFLCRVSNENPGLISHLPH
jgi:hypothetical protein